jgi:hypothetical protein
VYTEFSERLNPLVAMTWALKKALVDSVDMPELDISTLNTDTDIVTTVKGPIPIYTARDEKAYVEYNTPSVVIFQPVIVPMRDMITNLEVYRDYDYVNGTVREFPEPMPSKVRFKIHAATRNPDNDAIINTWLTKKSTTLCGLNVLISPEEEEYDRMTVYWHEPEEMDSDDISRITEYTVDVRTRIEILDCVKRQLVRPAVDIVFTEGDYTSTKYYANALTAFNVYTEDTSIRVATSLSKFPRAGSCEFSEDGDTFTYTSRDKVELKGVTGIENFHHYGETINLVE